MTRQQLGENMSAHELQQWVLYFAYRERERERQEEEAKAKVSRRPQR